jgi:uncharacterized protein (UPF0332 family)
VNFRWEEYLALARELSVKGGEAAMRAAISRAYYAAYHTARLHKGSKTAVATRGGPHVAVWQALKESGDTDWRKAGNRGNEIRLNRQRADYDDYVPGLTDLTHRTLRIADEIVQTLGSRPV